MVITEQSVKGSASENLTDSTAIYVGITNIHDFT